VEAPAVLSLAKLAVDAIDYYEQMVARGVEEYYTAAKEAPGEWLGDSAEELGLDGLVDVDSFRRVLAHAHPETDEPLTDGKSLPKVPGFDATFCAPKSASLLFALGDPETSNEVRNAHDVAMREAFDVLQSLARGRRGRGGARLVAGKGLLGAAYRHRTSRAAEPHLHTHVVIPNLVYAPEDQRWSALDERPLYSWCKPVGYLYNAQLRYEPTARLGVKWAPVTKGMAEMEGFSRKVLRAFSTRRREIESKLETTGRSGAKAAQKAAYATRRAKDQTVDGVELVRSWRTKAAELGLDEKTMRKLVSRGRQVWVPSVGSDEADALYRWLARPEGLTAKRSTFDVRHVIEAVCEALPNGGRVNDVLALADAFLVSEHVLVLDADRAITLRRADGRFVPSGDALSRFTTPEMVAAEQRLLARAAERQGEETGITRHDHVERALAARSELSDEQVAMVRVVCGSGSGIDVVEGVAGSGKTLALAAAADAWLASGYRVHGCSLAARAAARLEEATGIPSCTFDRLLGRLDRGVTSLDEADVIVVDEAAMVGTRKLHELFDHADRAGAKVVLIGDPCQLPEIDAGGAFSGLRRTLGGPELTVNRRQHDEWERSALTELRSGDTDTALAAYRAHGRVHEHDEPRHQMVQTWLGCRLTGQPCEMLAPTVAAVEDLNRRARRELQRAGRLRPDEIVINGRAFAVGDEVMALRNAYDLGVLNGTRLRVEYVDGYRGNLHCVDDKRHVARIPFGYANDHLIHAYAMTIHKAQGATVQRALVLADETLTREHAYTALSRAAGRTDIYLDTSDLEIEAHAPAPQPPPADRLRASISRSIAQQLAVDQAPSALVPMEALRVERDRLQQQLRNRPLDNSVELRRLADRIRSSRNSLEQAMWRQGEAQRQLDELGPLGRKLHRRERTELEHREGSATQDIDRLTGDLRTLTMRHGAASRLQREFTKWEQQHGPELERLIELDHTIWTRQVAERSLAVEPPSRGIDRSLGLEL
jgi:conjugative relaxase-like TrwC/TraI family protein